MEYINPSFFRLNMFGEKHCLFTINLCRVYYKHPSKQSLDLHQKLITCALAHSLTLKQMSLKSVCRFLTNRTKTKKKYLTFFAEVLNMCNKKTKTITNSSSVSDVIKDYKKKDKLFIPHAIIFCTPDYAA